MDPSFPDGISARRPEHGEAAVTDEIGPWSYREPAMALARLGTAPPRVLFLGRSEGGWYHDHAAVSTIYRPEPAPIDVPSAPAVRLIPLGGLGEIGLNMMLVESGDDVIARAQHDAGRIRRRHHRRRLRPPVPGRRDARGGLRDPRLLVPPRAPRRRFRGVVLTHGHEDHIGALSYLLRDFDVPVYGTPLTLAIAQAPPRRARRARAGRPARLRAGGRDRDRAASRSRPIRVTHSIADGIGLAIETPVGTIVHTGDFKLDTHPVDDQQPDYATFAALGERGVLVPSARTRPMSAGRGTRARRPRWARPSPAASPRRRDASSSPPSPRTSTASSRSSTWPIRCGRRVALLGRSMVGNVAVAAELGYLTRARGLLVPLDELADLPAAAPDDPLHGQPGRDATPPSRSSRRASTSTSRRSPATS